MPAQLILNADDFGLTPGVNRAVEQLHRAGVLTSATLMATGLAFEHAVEIALHNPSLGIGCHIVLTDGLPVSNPGTIPTLVATQKDPALRTSLATFASAALRGRIDPEDITREAVAQIRRLQEAGLTLTHVDTHKHTHLFPAVLRPLLRALQETGVPAIRNPFEPRWTHALGHGGLLRRTQLSLLRRLEPRFRDLQAQVSLASRSGGREGNPAEQQAPIRTTDGSIGVSATGDLTPATLTQLLDALPDHGTFELVTHPGYNDPDLAQTTTRLRAHREVELHALLTCLPARLAHPNPPRLISYRDLAPESPHA